MAWQDWWSLARACWPYISAVLWFVVLFVVALGYSPWLTARSDVSQHQFRMLERRVAALEAQLMWMDGDIANIRSKVNAQLVPLHFH